MVNCLGFVEEIPFSETQNSTMEGSFRSEIRRVNRLGVETGCPFPLITASHNVVRRGGKPSSY